MYALNADDELLKTKFSVTNLPVEGYYNNSIIDDFRRDTLMDQRADNVVMESDAPRRGGGGYSESMINFRDGGSRGTLGPENVWSSDAGGMSDFVHDPRGWRDGVDMSLARAAHSSRDKFHRMGVDTSSNNTITMGEMSERQKRMNKNTTNRIVSNKLKTFNSALTATPYSSANTSSKYVHVQNNVADGIRASGGTDYGDTFANKSGSHFKGGANIVDIKRTRKYGRNTTDMDIHYYHVGGNSRKLAMNTTSVAATKRLAMKSGSFMDIRKGEDNRDGIATKIGLLSALTIRGTKAMKNTSNDIDKEEAREGQARQLVGEITKSLSVSGLYLRGKDNINYGAEGDFGNIKSVPLGEVNYSVARNKGISDRDMVAASILSEALGTPLRTSPSCMQKGEGMSASRTETENDHLAAPVVYLDLNVKRKRSKLVPTGMTGDGTYVGFSGEETMKPFIYKHIARSVGGASRRSDYERFAGLNKHSQVRNGGKNIINGAAGGRNDSDSTHSFVGDGVGLDLKQNPIGVGVGTSNIGRKGKIRVQHSHNNDTKREGDYF